MTPVVDDSDFILHEGEALEVIRALPEGTARACVSSPPYLSLFTFRSGGVA